MYSFSPDRETLLLIVVEVWVLVFKNLAAEARRIPARYFFLAFTDDFGGALTILAQPLVQSE